MNIPIGDNGLNVTRHVEVELSFVKGKPSDKPGMAVLSAQMMILKRNGLAMTRLVQVIIYFPFEMRFQKNVSYIIMVQILVCDNPKELSAGSFTCEASVTTSSTSCENTFDGEESTVWTSGLNGPDYDDSNTFKDGKIQWGYNTNVKIILDKEAVISGVQIINKVDEANFYENYNEIKLAFSNGFEQRVSLSSDGKQNEVMNLEQPVETSFVNVLGVSTFGHMPEDSWLAPYHESHTGFRSGLSEIRIFGCSEGNN